MFFRFIADTFFAKRYGHRAVVLETVAAVPGMVAGVWLHMKSLRKMKTGLGPKIREMMEEAENERMHLMIFIDIAQPTWLERWRVLFAQFIFRIFYSLLSIFCPKTHKCALLEEEVRKIISILHGRVWQANVDAPQIAIDYYDLDQDAKLTDVIKKVRADEEKHSLVNLHYSHEEYELQ